MAAGWSCTVMSVQQHWIQNRSETNNLKINTICPLKIQKQTQQNSYPNIFKNMFNFFPFSLTSEVGDDYSCRQCLQEPTVFPCDSGLLPRGVGTHLNFSIFLGIKSGCLGAVAISVLYKKCTWVSAPTALQGRINRIDIVQINGPVQTMW